MNRRGFLGTFATMAAAAMTLDPEKLLWRPEAKTIFIPRITEPEVILESTAVGANGFYGWVQTRGISNVLLQESPDGIDWKAAKRLEGFSDEMAHLRVYVGSSESVQYVYAKCGELIKRGSVVTWVDHCKDELRLCGPGDIPIGVKL